MTEIYIDKADLNMYQLKPAPPKWDLQEYIVTYLKKQDNRYLAWFLHYYEKRLTTMCRNICESSLCRSILRI